MTRDKFIRTFDPDARVPGCVQVDLGRRNVRMARQALKIPDARSAGRKMRGKAVAQSTGSVKFDASYAAKGIINISSQVSPFSIIPKATDGTNLVV